MSDLIGSRKAFTVEEIERSSLRLPVTVQLMDVSSEPFVEMVAKGKDELGIYSFETKPLPETAWKKGPHTVRFITEGTPTFLKDRRQLERTNDRWRN